MAVIIKWDKARKALTMGSYYLLLGTVTLTGKNIWQRKLLC